MSIVLIFVALLFGFAAIALAATVFKAVVVDLPERHPRLSLGLLGGGFLLLILISGR